MLKNLVKNLKPSSTLLINETSKKFNKNIYFEFSDENRLNQFIENLNLSQPQSRYLRNNTSRSTKIDLSNLIFDMRRIKSKSEVSLIRHAAKISAKAHINIMKSCKSGLKEYEVEADFIKHCMSERC